MSFSLIRPNALSAKKIAFVCCAVMILLMIGYGTTKIRSPSKCDAMWVAYNYYSDHKGYSSFDELLKSKYLISELEYPTTYHVTISHPGPNGDKAAYFYLQFGFMGSVKDVNTMGLVPFSDLKSATHHSMECEAPNG